MGIVLTKISLLGTATFGLIKCVISPATLLFHSIDTYLQQAGELGSRIRADPYYTNVGKLLDTTNTLVTQAEAQGGDAATNFYEDASLQVVKKLTS